MIVTEQLKQV